MQQIPACGPLEMQSYITTHDVQLKKRKLTGWNHKDPLTILENRWASRKKRHYSPLELEFLEKFQIPAPLFILVVSPQTLYHTSSLLATTQESRPFFLSISHSTQDTHCAYRGTPESVMCLQRGVWNQHLLFKMGCPPPPSVG